ncbi:MAG: hypothetical protein C0424_10335 [Sphingobacteriaceae bacterium]|nr:hypothetical protein [Sphingobacteriaceae bacterium]
MEIIQDIDRWLATGCNYEAGLQLYLKHGTTTFLKEYFATSRSSFAANKLKTELLKLRDAAGAVTPAPRENLLAPPAKEKATEPEAVQRCRQRIKDLLPIISTMHNDLWHAKTDEERERLAAQLVEKSQQRAELWRMLDNYEKTGVLPGVPNAERLQASRVQLIEAASPYEIAQRILTVRSQISKAKDRMEQADTDEKREKYLIKYQALTAELEALKKKRDELPKS